MKKGFTVIELLIVISVLVILIGIALPRFHGMQSNGRLVQAQKELQTIQAALESYRSFDSSRVYPATSTTVIASYLVSASPKVISAVLYDPLASTANTEYSYIASANGKNYVVCSKGFNGSIETTAIDNAGAVKVGGDDICVTNGVYGMGIGGSCSQNSDCHSQFCNTWHVCTDRSNGSNCYSGGDCNSGYCSESAGGYVCTSGASGSPCSQGGDCQSGVCNAGPYTCA